MLHAFLALLAGFATIAALIVAVTALLARLVPEWAGAAAGGPQAGYACVNLGSSFLSAAAGGFVTAWASDANPLLHVLALAIVVLAMGALSAIGAGRKHRLWYALTLLVLMPMGTFLGGLVRLRVVGILS
jgi:hypothetical protein